MSENINPYKFEEGDNNSSNSNLKIPLETIKDIGGIPLPKNEDMSKWGVVVAVIVVIVGLWFLGSWVIDEMNFKNAQIKACNENFQTLNVKYILKEQELQQIKTSESQPKIPINDEQPSTQ